MSTDFVDKSVGRHGTAGHRPNGQWLGGWFAARAPNLGGTAQIMNAESGAFPCITRQSKAFGNVAAGWPSARDLRPDDVGGHHPRKQVSVARCWALLFLDLLSHFKQQSDSKSTWVLSTMPHSNPSVPRALGATFIPLRSHVRSQMMMCAARRFSRRETVWLQTPTPCGMRLVLVDRCMVYAQRHHSTHGQACPPPPGKPAWSHCI